MPYYIRVIMVLMFSMFVFACEPLDDRPGTWLDGEATKFPEDWSFTKNVREISVQVQTPYWIAHSVTIWCAELDGALYVGALEPESKMWPGWVMDRPQVVLKIAGNIYEAELVLVLDRLVKKRLAASYSNKYKVAAFEGDSSAAYWQVAAASHK